MKGIILAGGSGTRLYPLTLAVSKQLLPVYDKPMIYYPISALMLAGIREVLIITTPHDRPSFERLLGDGSQIGCSFQYATQAEPGGLAQALTIGESFIGDDKVALCLGDNIFYGSGFGEFLRSQTDPNGAIILASYVNDPQRYGVVELDSDGKAISLEEKPVNPRSNYAVPGLYFYDNSVVAIAKSIEASDRGEFEITAVNSVYQQQNQLTVRVLNRGIAWLDAGTFKSLDDASTFVRVIEQRQGTKIGCIEEVAYYMEFIDRQQLMALAETYQKSGYGEYLQRISDWPTRRHLISKKNNADDKQ